MLLGSGAVILPIAVLIVGIIVIPLIGIWSWRVTRRAQRETGN
jgi:hypothetical protein